MGYLPKPLCIDLFCGLGGWSEGFLAEGYLCIGFDLERHDYGTGDYPGQLVLQDVRTLYGSQFKDAAAIVASPPCQEYSYMAMPWSRAKQIRAALLGQGDFPEGYRGSRTIEELNLLFNECFRLQREASEAAGRHIPLIVENVRGAQEWVGPARWNYGSFYLWGDVPALMPTAGQAIKCSGLDWAAYGKPDYKPHGFNVTNAQRYREGLKVPNNNGPRMWSEREVQRLGDATKTVRQISPGWRAKRYNETDKFKLTNQRESDAVKVGGDWFSDPNSPSRMYGSKSDSRKAASAEIAKIPFALARHIARCFQPQSVTVAGVS